MYDQLSDFIMREFVLLHHIAHDQGQLLEGRILGNLRRQIYFACCYFIKAPLKYLIVSESLR